MKTYITFLLLIAAMSANAQTQLIKVKSKNLVLADSILMPKYGREIINIPANVVGDTVRSVDYIYHPTSDTTSVFTLEVRYYSKSGSLITTFPLSVPGTVFPKWAPLETKLFQYIFANIRRLQQQN